MLILLLQAHTVGHDPDLMRVEMIRNSPGKDVNLHAVRVETARYGFYIQI
jgi:hypothetical protein